MLTPELFQRCLNPRSIALIGATDRSTWSLTAFENLKAVGFDGELHMVNRRGGSAHGQSAASSCRDIGAPVDTALVMVPADGLQEALQDAASAGIRFAVIVSSGFAEVGAEGAKKQRELSETAGALGISLLGPNCLGFISIVGRTGCWTGAIRTPPLPGRVAIVSQSGAVGNYIAHFAHQQAVGLSYVISTGNEACLDLPTIADFLVDDPSTRVIAMFAETMRDAAAFKRVAKRARQAGKPLVMLKVGRCEETARVAQSHTGALVGDDAVFDGMCRQLGVVRVDSIEELVTTANLMEHVGTLQGDGVGVVSISGGICELAADWAHAVHVRLPPLSRPTVVALAEVLPSYGTPNNPLDMTGAAVTDTTMFERTLTVVQKEPAFSLLACLFEVPTGSNNDWTAFYRESVASIGRAFAQSPIPAVLISHTAKPVSDMAFDLIGPDFPYIAGGIELGMRAIKHALAWSAKARNPTVSYAEPNERPAYDGTFPNSEREAMSYLEHSGVPVVPMVLARTAEEAVTAARDGPVALKLSSEDIAHKSDIGGVMLDVCGDAEVGTAFRKIIEHVKAAKPEARIEGVLVAPMRKGLELFVGVKRDPQWGLVLVLGLGGVWIEVLRDLSLRLLPVTRGDILEMLSELRGARLLDGYRGAAAVDRDALAAVVVRIACAAAALDDALETLEVNPLCVDGDRIEALDALATRSGCE